MWKWSITDQYQHYAPLNNIIKIWQNSLNKRTGKLHVWSLQYPGKARTTVHLTSFTAMIMRLMISQVLEAIICYPGRPEREVQVAPDSGLTRTSIRLNSVSSHIPEHHVHHWLQAEELPLSFGSCGHHRWEVRTVHEAYESQHIELRCALVPAGQSHHLHSGNGCLHSAAPVQTSTTGQMWTKELWGFENKNLIHMT